MVVHIDNHYQSKIYTTSSVVSGHIEVNVHQDVDFSLLQILLLGTSRTRIDAVSIPQATSHTFLKLTMPIPREFYPEPRRFEAGSIYTIPFHFVIPDQLTINACSHHVSNETLKEQHVRLPPTLGTWDKDDFAPLMSRVTYQIRARAYNDNAEGQSVKAMEATQEIKVLPVVPEDAPLVVSKHDKLYAMSKTKTLRKSILSAKSGKITLSAKQPRPVMLNYDTRSAGIPLAELDLVFQPTSNESQPPKITSVSSKISAVTYYSAGGVNQYPNLKDWSRSYGSEGRGSYTGSVSLPTASIENVSWKQHISEQARRDSGYCSEMLTDSDQAAAVSSGQGRRARANKGAPYYYAAKIQLPIDVPVSKRQFVPTFHSCITSRVYVLSMTVTLSTSTGSSTNMTLSVPLQVGVAPQRGSLVDATGLPTFEAAMQDAELEIDPFTQSRAMSVPNITFQSELPGYAELSGTRIAV
ncbi:arrestin [Xylariaceae sp. FL1272]|nr:arrestin [Xylariaceae sp. FL1272]